MGKLTPRVGLKPMFCLDNQPTHTYLYTDLYYREISALSYNIVVGVMKMGNIAPRMRIQPTSLTFQASVLAILPPRLPDGTTQLMPTCLCGNLPKRSM